MTIAADILSSINKPDQGAVIRSIELKTTKQNQLLFFLKPECFLAPVKSQQELLDIIFSIVGKFSVEVSGCVAVNGPQLQELGIMDRHYGYINGMSQRASKMLNKDDKNNFLRLLSTSEPSAVLGGHEVLAIYPKFSPTSLDKLWSMKRSARVRGGLYGQVFNIEGNNVLVINGFHPAQLAHFTASDRIIVILILNSDLPWTTLRKSMIGDTFPDKAELGSIRRTIYEKAQNLGLDDVSISNNYCHLSAGPFEALFELQNFLERLPGVDFTLNQCRLADHLNSIRGASNDVQKLLENPILHKHPQSPALFTASEDCDAFSAAHLAINLS